MEAGTLVVVRSEVELFGLSIPRFAVRVTPFQKRIQPTGGGLCAQAGCFMATLVLKEHTHERPLVW
jgi:hypothetical protein